MLHVLDDWSNLLESKGQIDVTYRDLEKAFDKVPHQRLLSKLHSYGINDVLIKWIESFLCSRMQRVRLTAACQIVNRSLVASHKEVCWDLFYLLFSLMTFL